MTQTFTLEYWEDDGWLVGRLVGLPGVFSQGQTLDELTENIRDAYELMASDAEGLPANVEAKRMKIELAV
jgi:predicted RNase H-like HicB family nuclease